MARSQDELQARTDEGGLLGHALKELLEDAVAVLIDDIVAFENLRGHFDVAKNKSAKALADHSAYGGGHRGEFLRDLGTRHFAERDDALGEIHGEVADAFQVIGNLQSSDDQAHFVIRVRAAAKKPDGVLINDDFHFVDARLEKKYLAGQSRGSGAFQADNGVQRAIHRAFDGAGHRNQVVHQGIVEHDFCESSG